MFKNGIYLNIYKTNISQQDETHVTLSNAQFSCYLIVICTKVLVNANMYPNDCISYLWLTCKIKALI